MAPQKRTIKIKTKLASPPPKAAAKEPAEPASALKAKKTISKQPAAVTKSAAAQNLEQLSCKRDELLEELKKIDRQIYDLETKYLDTSNPQGNALIGYEGLVTQAQTTQQKQKPKSELRLFSLSSVSGAAHATMK